MPSTVAQVRPYAGDPVQAGMAASSKVLFVLVFGAVSFNLALCFANTTVFHISEFHVVACEALILSLVFAVSYRSIEKVHLILIGFTILWTLSFASVRFLLGSDKIIDIKIIRDLAIPIAFFLLGARARNAKTADTIVGITVGAVLVLALFEYFWVEGFTRIFNVASYYIARGTIEAHQIYQSSDLFVSGIRPAGAQGGRNLLPFIGDHRVSSLFLEPVSMGNFGVIAFMWGAVRSRFDDKLHLGTMLGALAAIVAADSRFGAYLCVMTILIMFLPQVWMTLAALILPAGALAVLALVPLVVTGSYDPQNRYIDNGFVGRFVLSADILANFDFWTWFGLQAPRMQVFDSGYAYIISRIGIVGLAIFWVVLFSVRSPSRQFTTFRNLAAIYFGMILCVSNSPFTIKTGALLWFLVGVLAKGDSEQSLSAASERREPYPDVAVPQSAGAAREAISRAYGR
jgi:putative polymerase